MQILRYTALLIALIFLSTSCTEEYLTSTNEINCTMNFEGHAKAMELQSVIDNYTADGFVGMTLLVDEPNDGRWIGSSGYANIEQSKKMNPCHIHHTASLYKTFIATVILQLVEENKIGLEDKLSDHLDQEITDQLPNGNLISIKNLLQHRTGIPDIFEIEFITGFFNHPKRAYSIEALLEFVYDKEALSEPGAVFHYSDANFSLLTLLIEKVEGNYFESVRSRIFDPLNLNDSYFIEDINELPDGLAESYWDRYNDGKIENNADIQQALTVGLRGSDGIVSTADDLKTYLQALANGNLVSDLGAMTEFLAVPEEVKATQVYAGYGMGLMQVNLSGAEWYGHFGNQIGSGAIMLYNAEKDITLVILQNTGTFFSDEIKSKFFYQLLVDIEAIVL